MPFNPADKLIKLQGKDYLQVRDRLLWLREAQPDAAITTEIVAYSIEQEWAIVKATVSLSTGATATGMAFQRPTGIAKDFVANGETSAIGRALGALGFGTQFAIEFDQPDGQVVDSPVARGPVIDPTAPSTEAQRDWYIATMARLDYDRAKAIDVAVDIMHEPVFASIPAAHLRDIVAAAKADRITYGPHPVDGLVAWRIVQQAATETPAVR